MALFCPPSNRIRNPSGKLHSTVSCVLSKHTSVELECLSKRRHQTINVTPSPAFSLPPTSLPLPLLSTRPWLSYGFTQLPRLEKPMHTIIHRKSPNSFLLRDIFASLWAPKSLRFNSPLPWDVVEAYFVSVQFHEL